MEAVVLRYGHRLFRDQRVTSHCCLVARAFGASEIVVEGIQDPELEKNFYDVAQRWGGTTKLSFTKSWKKTAQEFRKKGFYITHLTMYGKPVQEDIQKIREKEKHLVIIGSQKVEPAVYEFADKNTAITSQPHSEIAALAVFLDRLFDGKELDKKFENAEIEVVPQEKGKKTVKKVQKRV
ncbi:MAG: tRNA (cytidine(56)-2'-O)-methyltransferase [Candidatus Diapherotrites archaeon]|nr:tRNA (cytidine(56)-2'-O)-methyltransferase [Candidatus Diapherotrites archaeon]